MKQNKIKQFIILDQNEAGFAFDLNESLRKLADQDAVATFDGDRCRIEYTMTVEQEETPIEDKGITFTCGDCPMMEPITKRDGTPDERRKIGCCDFSKYGKVNKTARACPRLYRMIENGQIYLAMDTENQEETDD